MRKTIFSELFFFNMLTVLLAMLVTALLLYTQLGSYFNNYVYENLFSRATNVSRVSALALEALPTGMATNILQRAIEYNDGISGIIIFDDDAQVVVSSNVNWERVDASKATTDIISQALYGESVSGSGHLGGVLLDDTLYVMEPIRVKNSVEGIVLVYSAKPYISDMRLDVMLLFFSAVLIAAMLAFLISAVVSQRIARPIREMTNVAKKIASGDYSQKVSTDAKGELQVLASSFNQMSAAIKETDDMQSAFISDVSHELRTPMTIISGFVEGILDGTIPENEQRNYLEIVLSETKRLSRLVNDLLEMSRLKSGKIEYKMVPFDINENLRQGIISFDKRLSEKNINLEVNFEQDSSYVLGSRDSIYRVITNLMDNAVKFTPDGGEIIISTRTENGKTKISIQNSGEGLSEKELIHIWDRFYQTDKSRTGKTRGAGLGLYIVRNIMVAHNNAIYAESEQGKYTRFTFELDSVKRSAVQQERGSE